MRVQKSQGTTWSKEDLQLQKVMEEHDIKSFLTIFEWMMSGYKVRQVRWALKLVPKLTGWVQHAFAAMDPMHASDYGEVKAVILWRYDISETTYHSLVRSGSGKEGRRVVF